MGFKKGEADMIEKTWLLVGMVRKKSKAVFYSNKTTKGPSNTQIIFLDFEMNHTKAGIEIKLFNEGFFRVLYLQKVFSLNAHITFYIWLKRHHMGGMWN